MFGAQDAIIQTARCASDLVFLRDFGHRCVHHDDDNDVGVISENKAIVFCRRCVLLLRVNVFAASYFLLGFCIEVCRWKVWLLLCEVSM